MKKVQPQNLSTAFQKNLRAIREAKHLSQAALATKAGSVPKTISELENGRTSPTLKMIERLAGALDVDSDVLLTEDGAEIFLSATA